MRFKKVKNKKRRRDYYKLQKPITLETEYLIFQYYPELPDCEPVFKITFKATDRHGITYHTKLHVAMFRSEFENITVVLEFVIKILIDWWKYLTKKI